MQRRARPAKDVGWRHTAGSVAFGVYLAIAQGSSSQGLPTGSITGHVKLTSRVRGVALPQNAYSPRTVSRYEQAHSPEMRSVIVYLKDATYRGVLPLTRRQIRQEHES